MMIRRVLLKLSGEALSSEEGHGFNTLCIENISDQIKELHIAGYELAVVVGGGNFIRGATTHAPGLDRATADYMGMIATILNALALQCALENLSYSTRVLSALPVPSVAEPYVRRRALRHLEKNRIVILAAGTGNPYFTTDSAAAQRANELGCHILIKATKVDGVYSADPIKDRNAIKYDKLSFKEAIEKNLAVMDSTAFSLCRDNNLPILVCSMHDRSILRALRGEPVGTKITN